MLLMPDVDPWPGVGSWVLGTGLGPLSVCVVGQMQPAEGDELGLGWPAVHFTAPVFHDSGPGVTSRAVEC